tara:strand:- start:11 stop:391 length:381 start_codon:yes stop_codon:yes gene_type:complete
MILKFFYLFSLFIILTPGFLLKQKPSFDNYILNSLLFIIIFSITFPLVNDLKENYTSSYEMKLSGVSDLIKILDKFIQEDQVSKVVNIKTDFNRYKCDGEMKILREENKILKDQLNEYVDLSQKAD